MAVDTRCRPAQALISPLALLALGLWLLNDHLLKGAVPSALTGKLSDVACLVVVPLVPVAALELWCTRSGRRYQPRLHYLLASVVFTGLVMISINVSDGAATIYRYGLGAVQWPFRVLGNAIASSGVPAFRPVQLTMDVSDLWTLPSLLLPLWLATREPPTP